MVVLDCIEVEEVSGGNRAAAARAAGAVVWGVVSSAIYDGLKSASGAIYGAFGGSSGPDDRNIGGAYIAP